MLCGAVAGSMSSAVLADSATLGPDNQSSDPALRAAYNSAFQAMLADPGNLDKTFTFAGLAIQTGDYEGAIAAMERMLLVDPNLPRVRLELGALYFRLGSFEMARTYLQNAMAAPNVPPAVQERIRTLLAQIDQQQAPNHFSGSILSGLRYQTNANTGPPDTNVLAAGTLFTLDSRFTAQHDWNWFSVIDTHDVYDFKDQAGTVLESSGTLYLARQFKQRDVNLGYAEFTSGPRVPVSADWLADVTVRPYWIGDFVGIHDSRDYWATGAGLDLNKQFDPETIGDVAFEVRDKWFRNSAALSTNSDRDGLEYTTRLQAQRRLTASLTLVGQVAAIADHAKIGAQANTEYDFTLGVTYSYIPPVKLTEASWVSNLAITRAVIPYDSPDPSVDPNNRRVDHDWRLTFVTTVPLADDWAMVGTLGRTLRASSIPNFSYQDNTASIGVSWRF